MSEESDRWERDYGIDFLKKIGLSKGMTVLDFGAGYGHYTIPAASVVGKDGKVYAVEKDEKAMDSLEKKRENKRLYQIELIDSEGSLDLNLDGGTIDFFMLYDIIHYFDKDERGTLYEEVKRLLRDGGILSIYPKHTEDDFAMDRLKNRNKSDIVDEIKSHGLSFEEKICDDIIHDESIISGCVFNFKNKL